MKTARINLCVALLATLLVHPPELIAVPLATNVSLGTPTNTPVTLPVAWFLMHASDTEGKTIYLAGVTDPAHGTATLSVDTVEYTPDDGDSGPDTFDYIVRNLDGEETSATVSVTVYPAAQGPSIMSVNTSGAEVTVRAAGIPGARYKLEYITAPGDPGWRTVAESEEVTGDSGVMKGIWQITVSKPSETPTFYRVTYVSGP